MKSDQKKILKIFFSNTNKNVFVLKNMPEVLKGALFSRYSRSALPLRDLFIKEYINNEEGVSIKSEIETLEKVDESMKALNTQKAKEFYRKWLAMYGDDSIAELANIHIGIENISVLTAKIIEDRRIGISPLEKSTRYVRFDEKEKGEWKYYKDPDLMSSKYGKEVKETLDFMFETYSQMISPMMEYFRKTYPKPEEVSDKAYDMSIRAKTFDTVRGLLPIATKTNLGIRANGRAVEYLLTKMYAEPLAESQEIAKQINEESKKYIENFVERVESENGEIYIKYLKSTKGEIHKEAKKIIDKDLFENKESVSLIEYDPEAEYKVIASMIYPEVNLDFEQVSKKTKKLPKKKILEIIANYVSKRGGRWHKVGKPFEETYYSFDVISDMGAYKDLQRHRMASMFRQDFTTEHGYEIPEHIKKAGLEKTYRLAMDKANKTYKKIKTKFPYQSQYVVNHGHFLRWRIKMNLREAFHLCELRSSPQGHPSYRKIAQEMYKLIVKVHPILGQSMKFVNMDNPGLERLAAEVRKEERLNALSKKTKEKRQ